MIPSIRTFASAYIVLAGAALAASAATGPFEGFWERSDESAEYDSFMKVEADSGYLCVLDGKSSFRFKIAGDSITTPMNGKDAIALTPDHRLRISGEEKGEAYLSEWTRMDASGYPKACVDEEEEWYGPTAIRGGSAGPVRPQSRGPAARPAFGFRGNILDAQGRILRKP